MGKYHEAVKKGGDFWIQELPDAERKANRKNSTFADSVLFDKLNMQCSSRFSKVNGGGYTDAHAGNFAEYLEYCVL